VRIDLADPFLSDALRALWENLLEKHDFDCQCLMTKLLENPHRKLAYDAWKSLVRDKARWDFNRQILNVLGIDAVRLCYSSSACRWYDSDVLGNIHFGYVGRAAGFLPVELYVGAGKAQQEGTAPGSGRLLAFGDNPLDMNAIRVGIELYQKSKSVTVASFRSTLLKHRLYIHQGNEPPFLEYRAPYPIDPGLGPRFAGTYFEGG
jgi:hypothetical protein